jgi:hypothetical protein
LKDGLEPTFVLEVLNRLIFPQLGSLDRFLLFKETRLLRPDGQLDRRIFYLRPLLFLLVPVKEESVKLALDLLVALAKLERLQSLKIDDVFKQQVLLFTQTLCVCVCLPLTSLQLLLRRVLTELGSGARVPEPQLPQRLFNQLLDLETQLLVEHLDPLERPDNLIVLGLLDRFETGALGLGLGPWLLGRLFFLLVRVSELLQRQEFQVGGVHGF